MHTVYDTSLAFGVKSARFHDVCMRQDLNGWWPQRPQQIAERYFTLSGGSGAQKNVALVAADIAMRARRLSFDDQGIFKRHDTRRRVFLGVT